MDGHDHHAIIPEARTEGISGLSETEKNVYGLVVNRLLCAVDKPYRYEEANYTFSCNGIIYKLKKEIPVEQGWKAYDTEKEESADNFPDEHYAQGSSFIAEDIKVKEIETQPPKHFTDASLLSVMANIDNRIDDKSLKSAVSGKGIGTEATRADVIEELIKAGYAERSYRNIVSTKFGRDFIASIPDSVKSVERTAEWEQFFTDVKEKDIGTEQFFNEVKDFVTSVISLETAPDRSRKPLNCVNPNAPMREPIGICPRCGKRIFEGKKNFYCESGRDGCGFTLWKEDRYNGITVTPENAADLIAGRTIRKAKKKLNGETVRKSYLLEDTGKYINIRAEGK